MTHNSAVLKQKLGSNSGHLPSSSLGATTSVVERFILLSINSQFPITAILDAASPILYFQFLHVVSYVIFPSIFWAS